MNTKELLEKYSAGERNFQGVDLRLTNLRGANLGGASLIGACFIGADLRGVNFIEADLRGVNFRGTDLRVADLRRANLSGADLAGANLYEANLFYIHFKLEKHDGIAIYGQVQIDCEIHSTEWWLKNYVTLGKSNDYSDIQIEAYGKMIRFCADYFAIQKGE